MVAGLALGIATAVALVGVSSALERHLGAELDRYGANIVVAPQSDGLDVSYGGTQVSGISYDLVRLETADLERIRSIELASRLSVVAPVLVGSAEVEGRRVAIAGVDFEEATRIKPWWRVYGDVPAAPDEVLVGYDAARAFGLLAEAGTGGEDLTSKPVDPWYGVDAETGAMAEHAGHASGHHDTVALSRGEVTIAGARFRVAGILEPTGSADDRLVFADLARVQAMLGRSDELSLVEVSALCTDCPVEEIVAQIQSALPSARVTAVRQAVAARSMTVARLARFGAALAAVVLVVAALLVFVTMTSSIAERRREIGVLRAVGFRRAHVLKIIGLEVVALGAIAGLVGWLAGWTTAVATARYLADGAEVAVSIGPLVGVIAVTGAILVGALGALYPALRASRLDPTEALRHV